MFNNHPYEPSNGKELYNLCKNVTKRVKKIALHNQDIDLYQSVGMGKDGTPTSWIDREAEKIH